MKKKTETTERGIHFMNDLIPLIRTKAKTVTRRPQGLARINIAPSHYKYQGRIETGEHAFARIWKESQVQTVHVKFPLGKVGDFLYIKESYTEVIPGHFLLRSETDYPELHKWKSSRFMPKSIAKNWVQIKYIGVERLSEISEEQALEEGVTKAFTFNQWMVPGNGPHGNHLALAGSPEAAFFDLFSKLYGTNIIEIDPWVWVVGFEYVPDYPKSLNLKRS